MATALFRKRCVVNIFEKRESEIIQSFAKESSWEGKYRRIIEWGKQMNHTLPESQKKDNLLVRGCQSKVWLFAVLENHKVIFKGDSDALITKGLVSLMIYFLFRCFAKGYTQTTSLFY